MEFADRVLREAEKKATEMVEEAKKQAEKIIQEAHEQWRNKAEATRRQIIEEALRQGNLLIAEAKIKSSILISRAKQEIVDSVFAQARAILVNRDFNVKESLKNLVLESLEYCKLISKVVVNERDVDIAREVLRELGLANVEIIGTSEIVGGVVVFSEEGVVVDNSYDTRLKQAEHRLIDKVSKMLWG